MTASVKLYGALERLVGRRSLWRVGRWLYHGSRRELRNSPELNGEYSLQRWMVEALVARQPDVSLVFCDVGANVGKWSEQLLGVLRDCDVADFVVHACEPAPAQFQALSRRLPADDLRVHLDGRGVAAACGKASFEVTGEASGTNAIAPADGTGGKALQIEVTTLDAICRERGYPRLDFVKVDTEGNDFNVIQGAREMFDRRDIWALQFEYNWRWVAFRYSLREVFEFLRNRPYVLGRLTASGLEYYPDWHPELERFIETNYLIVRSDLASSLPHETLRFDASNMPCAASDGAAR